MKKETTNSGISRRTFLKTAGTGAAIGILGIAAAGCGSTRPSSSPSSDSAPAAVKHTWEIVPKPIADNQISSKVDAAVVIVGAGIAGMSAFLAANEAGSQAVIIEKTPTINARGLDNGAVDSKLQKAAGIKIDKGALINDLMQAAGYKANGRLLKLWADKSGEVFDYIIDLVEKNGGACAIGDAGHGSVKTDGFWQRTYPTDHVFGKEVHKCQQDLVKLMEAKGIESGGKSYYNNTAVQLVKDSTGKMIGVIAKDKDGKYIKYNASKAVILATGDYGANKEMVDAWCPIANEVENSVYTKAGINTGDGINMAMWAGGSIQKYSHAPMIHPIFGGGALSTASFLRVDRDGNRFCNEDTPLPGITNSVMIAPNKLVWTIFDSNYEAQLPGMSELSIYNYNTSGPLYFAPADGRVKFTDPPSASVKVSLEDGTTVTGNTIEELAAAMNMPADNLKATIARYNELVERGKDEDFGKDNRNLCPIKTGPFFASKVPAKLLVIVGGLNVDYRLRVLDKDDKPIDGLYAIGNTSGNFFGNDYPLVAPGLSHGRCLTFGRLLGQAVAKDKYIQ
ncbi:MAG TPA: FAD-binding protein [Negativicutes bacterium]